MLIIEGWLRLGPSEFAKLKGAASTMVAVTRTEAGCIHYAFAQDIDEPDLIRISEKWEGQAALDAHFASPHMASFNQAMSGLAQLGADIRLYSAEELRKLI